MPGERKVGQDHGYYDWSPIVTRPPLKWPNDARVALVVIVNLEHYDWDLPRDDAKAPAKESTRPPTDLTVYGQHDYGNRVGVFRILKILDKHGIKPTIAMDKTVAEHFPYLVRECKNRGLEIMAHGISARRHIQSKMSIDAERAYIRESIAAVEKAMGKKPAGWLGPEGHETMNTPNLLAAEGIRYVCDWGNDEQPYRMKVSQGELFSLGADLDLDDIYIHLEGRRLIDEYRQILQDAFDVLYADGAKSGRLMVVNLHPWVIGWPWRTVYLDRAFAHISKFSDVWKASGSEVIDWYKTHSKA